MPDKSERLSRRVDLDLFKTFLVVGMVLAHTIQLLQEPIDIFAKCISNYVNLVSFSGFLFAFGWGTTLSFGTNKVRTAWDRLRGPAKILLAFYLTAIAHLVLIDGAGWSATRILDVATLMYLPGHGEFLASLFAMSIVMIWLGKELSLVSGNPTCLIMVSGISVLCGCFHIESEDLPWVPILIGTKNAVSFPLAPYAIWVFLGSYYAPRKGPPSHLEFFLAALATYTFVAVAMTDDHLASRFPPSTLWVAGPALFLLLYRAVSMEIVKRIKLSPIITLPGHHILVFLVASNFILFALHNIFGRFVQNIIESAALTAIIIAIISKLIELFYGSINSSRDAAPISSV
ncbi:hypothetical protein [Methylobacterium sp. NEAU K]|uniref:hypothetical protein n=1 Tax=Methylobacterium sp. NEAU K TaxID=3064946 RepID=UPI002734B500|nr:hypothetical protein [Methylobacterium sp. NEAU K]MDP4005916.1 hypothetical protein [Methylobacterium sp. NEAU K]